MKLKIKEKKAKKIFFKLCSYRIRDQAICFAFIHHFKLIHTTYCYITRQDYKTKTNKISLQNPIFETTEKLLVSLNDKNKEKNQRKETLS